MSTACIARPDSIQNEIAGEVGCLRERYQALTVARATPVQKAQIAHLGVKIAELLHLVQSADRTEREVGAIRTLVPWIAGRVEALEAQGSVRPLLFIHL